MNHHYIESFMTCNFSSFYLLFLDTESTYYQQYYILHFLHYLINLFDLITLYKY